MKQKVATFTSEIINLLELNIQPGTPIYLSDSNVEHMRSSHPDDYQKYGSDIRDILSNPDYVGRDKNDNSVEFVKEYDIGGDYVKVAVRVSTSNVYYARSLYVLNPRRVKNFISKGTLKSLDK